MRAASSAVQSVGRTNSFVTLGENVADQEDGLQRQRLVYAYTSEPVSASVGPARTRPGRLSSRCQPTDMQADRATTALRR